jgi:hypothetical protein
MWSSRYGPAVPLDTAYAVKSSTASRLLLAKERSHALAIAIVLLDPVVPASSRSTYFVAYFRAISYGLAFFRSRFA